MKLIVHLFCGGQLGNQLRVYNDLALFSAENNIMLVSIPLSLYLTNFGLLGTPSLDLSFHKPSRYIFLPFLYISKLLFIFVSSLSSLLSGNLITTFLTSSDSEYFGIQSRNCSPKHTLDSSFYKRLGFLNILWGYEFVISSKYVISQKTIIRVQTLLKKAIISSRHFPTPSIPNPYVFVHVRRSKDFCDHYKGTFSDSSFIELIYQFSLLKQCPQIVISSDKSDYSSIINYLEQIKFTYTVSKSCGTVDGTLGQLVSELVNASSIIGPPSTLSVFLANLFDIPFYQVPLTPISDR
jgi:hypothetical protein